MSDFTYTPAQREAIEAPCPVLVSAAAGSGKTRVLTERLLARVKAGEDISRFLVITFTRAAAAELRARILAELSALSAQTPGDRHLRRQSALLYRAPIGTIDSFCANVVRENAHRLGISPGFTVLEEEKARSMRTRALEDVLERAYEDIGQKPGLRDLVDSVGEGRDDARLAERILSLHDQLQSRAWPEKWAAESLAALDAEGLTDAGQTVWGRVLLEDGAAEAEYRARTLEEALSLMAEPGAEPLMKGYGDAFSDLAGQLRDIARAAREGWDKARSCVFLDMPRLGSVRKYEDTARKERVKAVWDDARAAVKKLQAAFQGESGELLAQTRRSRPALSALMELVFALDREYAARKRRADACDFSDVEHFCVSLLTEEDTGEPTPLAAELSARFAEVMVDEYQDVNSVQELIFRRVSGEGARLFMVGDVKQSIYRFRLAEPAIFNARYEAMAGGGAGRRVLLRENFRSRGAVLNACNAVFSRIMSPALGEIEYDDGAALVQGAAYPPEGEVRPELCVIDPGGTEEETPDKRRLEARYVAGRIRAMVAAGEPVSDGRGGTRPVEYGDIAVLMRTPGTSGAAFRRALAEAGVPVNARQGGAFFAQPEVSFALSMLAAADNPRQDVPLIAALRGLPFAFTPDELTAVRSAGGGDFWDALCRRAGTDEKCARFVETLQTLRDMAREEPTESLLRWLYDRTGLFAACAVQPDGLQRSANLMQLYEYARRFEADGNRGLFRFVEWLRRLEERGIEPPAAAVGGAVQILSIHKSKGLEYPVVFLVDNSHQWNRGAAGQAVLCHNDLGLGMRRTDGERGIDFPTLPWLAIRQRLRREELSEQERVLYVAMTRARERLIMTCVQKDGAGKLAVLGGPREGALEPRLLSGAQNTAQWLMRAAAADGGRTIDLRIVTPAQAEAAGEPPAPEPPAEAPEADVAALAERLSWQYPGTAAVSLPSKLTATGLRRAREAADPEAMALEDAEKRSGGRRRFRAPDLGRTDAPLTGAERGVAQHLVMQYIDFGKTGSAEAIAGEIRRLREEGFLDERQAAAVPPEDIEAFFRSDIGRRLLRADRVLREFRFSLLCPADRWFPEAPAGEEILLQGVVDCCIEEAGRLTVIDFKTDGTVEPERHEMQLRAYASAMERITGKPVSGAVLWYLRHKRAVAVSLEEGGAGAKKTVAFSEEV